MLQNLSTTKYTMSKKFIISWFHVVSFVLFVVISPRMLCPSEFKGGFRRVVFAQSPSPDWAKQKFSANSASLWLLLNLFTAEAQRTPREGLFCLSGDDHKQNDSTEWEEARKAYSLEEGGT
jgi:hypothetical protein